MEQAYMNWSGGKDSALCLYQVLQEKKYNIRCLLTSMTAAYNRVSIHGVRRSLLEAQAVSMGFPLHTLELADQPSMKEYEYRMQQKVEDMKELGCTHSLFGDIFLDDIRAYREKNLEQYQMQAVFPLWKKDTAGLVNDFMAAGFKAIVICVNEQLLDKSFCGRLLDSSFFNDLPSHVDPCGENGEFHSFVFDGPLFDTPVAFSKGELVFRQYDAPKSNDDVHSSGNKKYGFYFYDLLPQ